MGVGLVCPAGRGRGATAAACGEAAATVPGPRRLRAVPPAVDVAARAAAVNPILHARNRRVVQGYERLLRHKRCAYLWLPGRQTGTGPQVFNQSDRARASFRWLSRPPPYGYRSVRL